jgi:hypothetical protein
MAFRSCKQLLLGATLLLLHTVDATLTLVNSTASSRGFLRDENGTEYDLYLLEPYTDLFSPLYFLISGDTITDVRSNVSFLVPVLRGVYDNGAALVQAATDSEGVVTFAEVHRETASGVIVDTTKRADDLEKPEALRVSASDNHDGQASSYYFDDAPPVHKTTQKDQHLYGPSSRNFRSLYNRKRRALSSPCDYFISVKVAVIYDTEFCQTYGGHKHARNRIMAIVASASMHYERDMCVKLQLTDILTPDSSCRGSSMTFSSMNRQRACGTDPNLLSDFSAWMARKRQSSTIDPDALIHFFTGYPSSGLLGCAWRGTLCWSRYSYGVEYITMRSDILTQGVIFAHEVGHNVNAPHVKSAWREEFIMESTLSTATDGFSEASVGAILSFLNSEDITCDGILQAALSSPPSAVPSQDPSATRSLTPSESPSVLPSYVPGQGPNEVSSGTPSQDPIAPTSAYTFEHIRISAGELDASFNYTDVDGKIWSADDYYNNTGESFVRDRNIKGTGNDKLYTSQRFGPVMEYSIPVPPGEYEVKLHFAELIYREIGHRIFDVVVEDSLVLDRLDILSEVERGTALVFTETLTVLDGVLNIVFVADIGNPQICGIEVRDP